MLSHETAAELQALCEPSGGPIHVTVPHARKVRGDGVVVHRSVRADGTRHPAKSLPQTRVEETVLDMAERSSTTDEVFAWIARACGGRRAVTTTARIKAALADRSRSRWRREIDAAVRDVDEGCHSALERHYLRDVERAHNLPSGVRQAREGETYDDVRYQGYGVVVELDGRATHPDELRWRDIRRDNATAATGRRVLRYGWPDVRAKPCAVAVQVGQALRFGGWTAQPSRCRRVDCVIVDG
jgi:very-short-patch-repair endonuclease